MKMLTLTIIALVLAASFVSANPTGNITLFASYWDTLYVLRNGASNPIASFDLPSETDGLTFDGENWWMIKQPEGTIYCFDYGGDYVTDFPAPAANPTGLAWDGEYLWISCLLDIRYDDVQVYQVNTEGLQGPYGPFTAFGHLGLTVFEDCIATLTFTNVCNFYTMAGSFQRSIELGSSSEEEKSLTYDGDALWVYVKPEANDPYIKNCDPYTGEWLGDQLFALECIETGLASGVWSYTGVEMEAFGKIKAFFEGGDGK
ncbi:MAG: hypothetical protein JSW52_03315 [Candidatus Coatesbacteria bacterium]|nr:MAG: hypothetical protein JSW52_03315 [Candidatus Coatesbacteria bacterium]